MKKETKWLETFMVRLNVATIDWNLCGTWWSNWPPQNCFLTNKLGVYIYNIDILYAWARNRKATNWRLGARWPRRPSVTRRPGTGPLDVATSPWHVVTRKRARPGDGRWLESVWWMSIIHPIYVCIVSIHPRGIGLLYWESTANEGHHLLDSLQGLFWMRPSPTYSSIHSFMDGIIHRDRHLV